MSTRANWDFKSPAAPRCEDASCLSSQACTAIAKELTEFDPNTVTEFLRCCASAGWSYHHYTRQTKAEPSFKTKEYAARQIARQARALADKLDTAGGTRYYFDRNALRAGRSIAFLDHLRDELNVLSLIGDVAQDQIRENEDFYKQGKYKWPPRPEFCVAKWVAGAFYNVLREMPTTTIGSDSNQSSRFVRVLAIVLADFSGKSSPWPHTYLRDEVLDAVRDLKTSIQGE